MIKIPGNSLVFPITGEEFASLWSSLASELGLFCYSYRDEKDTALPFVFCWIFSCR